MKPELVKPGNFELVEIVCDNGEFSKKMAVAFQKRLDMIWAVINDKSRGLKMPVKPLGAFYSFIRCEELFGKRDGNFVIKSAADFSNYLLEKYDVVVVSGEAFGDSGAFRISFAMDEEKLAAGLTRLRQAADQLK